MKKIAILVILAFLFGTGCNIPSVQAGDINEAPTINPAVPQFHLENLPPQRYRPAQDKSLALAVAISGGGLRSANFAVGVLTAIEEMCLLKEIDYLSTVSGGGFAAAAFIETLIDHLEIGGTHDSYSLKKYLDNSGASSDESLKRHLQKGYQGSLLSALANPKTWFTDLDRGDLLEKKIDSRILGFNRRQRSLLLEDIFQDEKAAGCKKEKCYRMVPYWITNATVYENGAIFPFTPDILGDKKYNVVEFMHRASKTLLGNDKGKLPLAVAVKASASFPAVVPSTTLKCRQDSKVGYIHLLDGGLADNLGVTTAIKMLNENENINRKVLLIIDAYKGKTQPFSEKTAPNLAQVAFRIMGIGLDSNHSEIEARVRSLCESKKIIPIFLDFSALKGKEKEIIDRAKKAAISGKNGEPENGYSTARDILYRSAQDVKTSLNISREEQEILLEAGRMVVKLKAEEILMATENEKR